MFFGLFYFLGCTALNPGCGYPLAAYVGFFASFGYFILRTIGYVDQWGIGAGVTLSPAAALGVNLADDGPVPRPLPFEATPPARIRHLPTIDGA